MRVSSEDASSPVVAVALVVMVCATAAAAIRSEPTSCSIPHPMKVTSQ